MQLGRFCSHREADGRWVVRSFVTDVESLGPVGSHAREYHLGWNATVLRHEPVTPVIITATTTKAYMEGVAEAEDEEEELDLVDDPFPWQVEAWCDGANQFRLAKSSSPVAAYKQMLITCESFCVEPPTMERYTVYFTDGWQDAAWLVVNKEYRVSEKTDLDRWMGEIVALFYFCTAFQYQLRLRVLDAAEELFELFVPVTAYTPGASNFQFSSNPNWTIVEDFEEHVLDPFYRTCLPAVIPEPAKLESGILSIRLQLEPANDKGEITGRMGGWSPREMR
jgi:hypothetical protein